MGAGDHGVDGEPGFLRDAGRLIEEEQVDRGEAADVVADAGEADDAGAVGDLGGLGMVAIACERDPEAMEAASDLAEEFGGLALGRAGDDDQGFGVCGWRGWRRGWTCPTGGCN
ncbi:MAG: hypothetical protein ACKV22_16105 [Bryobacteraceae bacterium]